LGHFCGFTVSGPGADGCRVDPSGTDTIWYLQFSLSPATGALLVLFGPQISYTQEQIATAWGVTVTDISHEMIRRQFIGTPELGWKVAWSDRMVAMYTSIFLFGLLYALLRQWGIQPKGFSWKWLVILIVPMAIDGTTHLINDALRLDFRDVNLWAVWLTGGIFPLEFYAGDMFGRLNSLLRITTGLLFGLGVVGFLWPLMGREFSPRR
jgi:uncharacterized membrane protein